MNLFKTNPYNVRSGDVFIINNQERAPYVVMITGTYETFQGDGSPILHPDSCEFYESLPNAYLFNKRKFNRMIRNGQAERIGSFGWDLENARKAADEWVTMNAEKQAA